MKTLEDILIFKDSLPFLFIGSGFTRRYLNTPNWEGLLRHFASLIEPENQLAYHSYKENARQLLSSKSHEEQELSSINKLNSLTADLIEKDFNKMWYSNPLFEKNRIENFTLIEEGHSPFKIEIANFFIQAQQKAYQLPTELEKLKLLSGNSIAGIITTNYDCLLESFFDFTTYIGQEQLLFSTTQNICEIYKIHGCVTLPKSIIIDSSDYETFSSRSKYLASKLLTIFVEHPIIFIGYSITDENIRTILDDIIDCLTPEQLNILKSRFIFIEMLKDSSGEEFKIDEVTITSSRKEITMTRISLQDYGRLYEILSHNHTQYPVKWLRKLKENVYNLIATTTPTDKLKIMIPFEQLDSTENVEFVVGIGISQAAELAYATYSAEDIYLDIILNNKNFNSDLLITKTLPSHISRTCGSMPFYKYLYLYSKDSVPQYLKRYVTDDIEKFFNTSLKKSRSCIGGETINEIRNSFEFPRDLYYILRLPIKNIYPDELLAYLTDLLNLNPDLIKTGKEYPHSSDLRRLIKVYDWMTYYTKLKNKKASI